MATRGIASRLLSKGLIASDPIANQTPSDAHGFDIRKLESVAFIISVENGGSQGTINVTLQESFTTDANASYTTIPNSSLEIPKGQTPAPVAGVIGLAFGDGGKSLRIGYKGNASFVRAITSGVAGTPNFGGSVVAVGHLLRHING